MDDILMSKREREKLEVLSKVKAGVFSLKTAADLLEISYRQSRRIFKRYREEGDKGLLHRGRGRRSNAGIASAERQAVIELYESKYMGFGPTLAAEHLLNDDGHAINRETLRLWLLQEGKWEKKRKRKKHRSWRERKECTGEMIQMDGSHHDWFEGRNRKATLMVMVDDASSRTYARFYKSETTRACMDIFWKYTDTYNLPRSLYVDRHSIYRCEREATVEEQLKQTGPLTQFARAMQELDVRIIPAYSPQAKGRVERANRTMQDRLIKKMRLKGIDTIEEANRYLDKSFLPEYNARFNVVPRSKEDIHKNVPGHLSLDEVFCIEDYRQVQNDWTVRRNNRFFQLTKRSEALGLVKKRIVLREKLNGEIQLVFDGKLLEFKEVSQRPEKTKTFDKSTNLKKKKAAPAANHPWRKSYTKRWQSTQ